MDPAKLKVVELRAALAERGLDTKGNKPVLVERLRKALEEDVEHHGEENVLEEGISDTALKEPQEKVMEATRSPQPPRTPSRSSRSSTMVTPTKISTRNASRTATTPNSSKQSSPSKSSLIEKPREMLTVISETTSEESIIQEEALLKPSPEEYIEEEKDNEPNIIQNEAHISSPEKSQEEDVKDFNILEDSSCEANVSQVPAAEPSEKSSVIEQIDEFSLPQEEYKIKEPSSDDSEVHQLDTETSVDEQQDVTETDVDIKEHVDIDKAQDDTFEGNVEEKLSDDEENTKPIEDVCNVKHNEDIPDVQSTHVIPDQVDEMCDIELKDEKKTINDDCTVQEEKMDVSVCIKDLDAKMDNSDVQDKQAVEIASVKDKDFKLDIKESSKKDSRDRKRKRSPSPMEVHQKSPIAYELEDEPDIDESAVVLSWYDSDLNLVIAKDGFVSATPMLSDGFCYIWAGARASYGFINGKVYYETKITEHCSVNMQDQEHIHMLRVGWSIPYTSMQLGEEKFSYAYISTGKKGTDKEFMDYGSQFGKDDVIGCYLDMTSEDIVELSYTVNGKHFGSAFTIPKEKLGDRPLFPHILSKNCTFVCNFGQEEAWCERVLDYTLVGHVELKDRIPGPCRPDKKEDCKVIMMCGLPAAGKTVWARKHAAEHPVKLYNILGLHNLVEKAEDVALCQEKKHSQQEIIIDKCTRVLNKLIEMASSRRRNYILDQKNIYSSVQRRKMRNFCGYQRKAVVVVPTTEELNQRLSTHEPIEGKSTSESKLMEMKANFAIPLVGESFDVIDWVGLDEEEGKKLIEKYNKESKEAGFGPQQTTKRPRFDKTENNRETRDSRNNRDTRDMRDHRDRRNSYQDRNRNSPWRGGNNMGGWRGERPQRGGYMRHSSGYGPPTPWRARGRGGPAMRGADRRGGGVDRRSGNDRNRSSTSRQGGWGPMSGSYQGSQQSGWSQQDNWSGGQSQGNWNQQGGWGQQQWGGNWKGYGQGTYGQSGYNQQGYGNGNWNSWNQQYYNNQYWSQQQQQQQQSGQTTAAGGQAENASETVATTSTDTREGYSYS